MPRQLVDWTTLSDTRVLRAHPPLQCSQECWERNTSQKHPKKWITWNSSRKSAALHPFPPPPLPSRKTRLKWREPMLRTPKDRWYFSLSNSPGCYCSPGQNCKAGELGFATIPNFFPHYQSPRHYMLLSWLKSAPSPLISLDMPLDQCVISNANEV